MRQLRNLDRKGEPLAVFSKVIRFFSVLRAARIHSFFKIVVIRLVQCGNGLINIVFGIFYASLDKNTLLVLAGSFKYLPISIVVACGNRNGKRNRDILFQIRIGIFCLSVFSSRQLNNNIGVFIAAFCKRGNILDFFMGRIVLTLSEYLTACGIGRHVVIQDLPLIIPFVSLGVNRLCFRVSADRTRERLNTFFGTGRLLCDRSCVIAVSERGNDLCYRVTAERTRACLDTVIGTGGRLYYCPLSVAVFCLIGLYLKVKRLTVYFLFECIFVSSRRLTVSRLDHLAVIIRLVQRGKRIALLALAVSARSYEIAVCVLGRFTENRPSAVAMLECFNFDRKRKGIFTQYIFVYVGSCYSAGRRCIAVVIIHVVELGNSLCLDMDLVARRTFSLNLTALVEGRLVDNEPRSEFMHVQRGYEELREGVHGEAERGDLLSRNGIYFHYGDLMLLVNALIVGGKFLDFFVFFVVQHMVNDEISVRILGIKRDSYGKTFRVIIMVLRQIGNAYIHKLYSVNLINTVCLCPNVGIVIHVLNYDLLLEVFSEGTGNYNSGLLVVKILIFRFKCGNGLCYRITAVRDRTYVFLLTLVVNGGLYCDLPFAPHVVCIRTHRVYFLIGIQQKLISDRPVVAVSVKIIGNDVEIVGRVGKLGENDLLTYRGASGTFLYRHTGNILRGIIYLPICGKLVSESIFFVSLLLKLTLTAPELVSALGARRLYGLNVNKLVNVLGIEYRQAYVHRGHYRSRRFSVVRPVLSVVILKVVNAINDGKICTNGQIRNEYDVAVLIDKACLVYIAKLYTQGYVSRDLSILKEIHREIRRISGKSRAEKSFKLRSYIESEGFRERTELSIFAVIVAKLYADYRIGRVLERLADSLMRVIAYQIKGICL